MTRSDSATAALALIDEALDGMRDRPAMYGGPEAVLFQALLALDIRAAFLGGGDCRATYDAMRRERRIPCSMHAHQAASVVLGPFIAALIHRERARLPGAPLDLATLDVELRDDAACERISPEAVASHLAEHGWTHAGTVGALTLWDRVDGTLTQIQAPTCRFGGDYGRAMRYVVTRLADVEGRTHLAVLVDLVQRSEVAT